MNQPAQPNQAQNPRHPCEDAPRIDGTPKVAHSLTPATRTPQNRSQPVPSKETNMFDANRHGEPICGWSDLPVNGCAHCHGHHHQPAHYNDHD